MQHWVQLGNSNAVASTKDEDGEVVKVPVKGDQITAMVFPEGWGLGEMYLSVVEAAKFHFDDDPATDDLHPPAWVESSSPGLQAMLVEHYGLTGDARPGGWVGDHPSVASLKAGGGSDQD